MAPLIRVAERVLNTPLLVTPDAAQILLDVLGGRIGVGAFGSAEFEDRDHSDLSGVTPNASRFVGSRARANRRPAMTRMIDGAAIITIDGSLVNRGAWLDADCGMVSYEGIAAQLDDALKDPDVHGIVLDLNTQGGEASGMFALASKIREVNAQKPVIALANDMALSAGYGIASAASKIIVSPTSRVGSIGVVLTHMDRTAQAATSPVKPQFIYAGAHKIDGNPFEKMSPETRNELQANVDRIYDMFTKAVGEGRGTRLTTEAARSTEARIFLGEGAINAGLADEMGNLAEAIATVKSLTRSVGQGSLQQRPATDYGVIAPATLLNSDTEIPNMTTPTSAAPAVAEPAATSDAGAAMQTRIAAILNSPEAKGRETLAQHFALSTALPAEDAVAALAVAPKAEAPAQATSPAAYAERKSNAGALGAGMMEPPPAQSTDPWGAVIERANSQISARSTFARSGNDF